MGGLSETFHVEYVVKHIIHCQCTKRILLPMQEIWVRFLGQEDPQEEEMTTHSSILAWETPWTEESSRLQPMRAQRVRYD